MFVSEEVSSANAEATDSSLPISHFNHLPIPSNLPALTSSPITVAPWAFNFFDTASPMPDPEPVTTAVNPRKSSFMMQILSNTKRRETGFHQSLRFLCVIHRPLASIEVA